MSTQVVVNDGPFQIELQSGLLEVRFINRGYVSKGNRLFF